jgi:hypothetical protein
MLLAMNASFYKRVARLTKSVFPSANLLSSSVSTMVKSTFGSSSSSQEAVLLIPDVLDDFCFNMDCYCLMIWIWLLKNSLDFNPVSLKY